jgi:cobalt-zinc-cadmium efflux system protein
MHDHSSHQNIDSGFISRAFTIGIILNSLFVVIEAGMGLYIHSLSLLSDAGHNLADVGSLALSLLAYRLVKIKSNEKYTYGYRKSTILAALFNAVILLISIGAIGFEAVRRIMAPVPLEGMTISIVAGIGIVINGFTALMFLREKEKDINIKSAYLHLMSDAVVSLGLVAGGIVIFYTGYYWIDPLFSILIAFVILFGTWNLLKESLRLSMDAVPKGISLIEITETASKIEGIKEIHHIHCWALSTTENALTAHIVLENKIASADEILIKDKLKHELEHLNIKHVTLETEREDEDCGKEDCD